LEFDQPYSINMPLFYELILTLQLSLLYTAVAMSSSNNVLVEQQSASADIRNLQQTFNYRANYTADFQHITDPSCTGDAPVLQISCLSAQNMTILGKSSESIKCSPIDLSGIQGDTSYQCVNTCNGTSCNDVYLSTLIEQPKDGPYGSIQFMCEGNDYRQVDAAFIFLGGNNGSCTAANTSSPPASRNLHIAKFGISCPSQSSNGGIGRPREYVYDDAYFECNFRGSSTASASAFDSSVGSSDIYTCLTGGSCNGTECTDIQFNDIIIDSVVPKFLFSCVETTLPSITEIPSQSPVIRAVGDSISNVRFEALWANLYDPDAALTTCRYVNNTAVIISCGNGATDIRFRNSTDPNMNCTIVNDVDLYCIGDETKIKNLFTSVVFVSYLHYV
jgi:hypothetical protein